MDVKTLCSLIDERQQELYALLGDLIRIDSQNFQTYGNEKECPLYIRELCRDMGLEAETYSPLDIEGYAAHPDCLDGRDLANRFNVTARWRGKEDVDGLMLMGHHDTVRIGDRNNWSFAPLSGEVRDGNIWGRGACDDKYALATTLFLIRLLREQGFVPKKNILFTAYCDEEHGGSNGALASVLRYPCERLVNLDCKEFEIWQCASGGGEIKYCYHTKEPVDSAALAASAIPTVMACLQSFAANRRAELEQNPFYKNTEIPATSFRYMDIHAGKAGADLGRGELLFVYYTDKEKDAIWAELHQLEEVLAAQLAPMGIVGDGFVPNTRFFHYGYTDPQNASIRDMQAAAMEVSGRVLTPCASCLSDLSVLLKYGPANSYGFGIGRGFDVYGGAHQADEFLPCSRLLEFAKIIGAYILRCM